MHILHCKELLTPRNAACALFSTKELKISMCEAIMSATTEIPLTELQLYLRNIGRFGTLRAIFTKFQYMDHITTQAPETELHPNNSKREDGLVFSRSQKPLSH
jgi:hypothetical protein